MKTGAKADLAKNKGFAEIKKYIQKLYDHSKTLQWFLNFEDIFSKLFNS